MNKIIKTTAIVLMLFATFSYAGDNSSATLGDVKEAVYKLIVQSKKTDSRMKAVEEDFNAIKNQKKDDKLSLYISSFVSSNKKTLENIDH